MAEFRISALYTYPIKSCAGLSHELMTLGERGLTHDREWMIVDSDGMFITQREIPALALATPAFDGGHLTLNAPAMPTLYVSHDHEAVRDRWQVTVWRFKGEAEDVGDDASHWLSEYLGLPVRLVRMADDVKRLTSMEYTDQPGEIRFADGYPLLFISAASLADLNNRLTEHGKAPLPMNRFRPNVVISGCEPYAEDEWKRVAISGIQFDVVKPCARCVITTVDQKTGKVLDVREPLSTLAAYRRDRNGGVLFGQNVIHRGMGTLHVGDMVEVCEP